MTLVTVGLILNHDARVLLFEQIKTHVANFQKLDFLILCRIIIPVWGKVWLYSGCKCLNLILTHPHQLFVLIKNNNKQLLPNNQVRD